ncbi:MAG TPA: hypothetical protein PKE26_04040 [Kiritimatiellia bacterium]|nr:hypothetical protein [Kiritimatiellia bacterium]HMO98259.1 hypothetical protein [Kiritimatiellia bacterium]HMP96604.1 hypothetical protein [Kiritimatiellia bacterium]
MKKLWIVMAGLMIAASGAWAEDHPHRIGAGINYWVALDDIDVDNVDDDGFSYLLTYQYRTGLLGLQLDLEMLPDRFGEDAYAPAAYLLLGKALYAAVGVGMVYQDSEWADDPFIAFKAGVDLNLVANLYLDISASYRFDSKTKLSDATEDIDTDTVFLGAALRFGF